MKPTDSQPEFNEPKNAPAASRRQFLIAGAALAGASLVEKSEGFSAALASDKSPDESPALPFATMKTQGETAAIFNRAPLFAAPFAALPLGSVRARGWLLRQLELQRDGLTGHAEELFEATAPNSAWKGGDGEDWEKGPYYLKGLVALAYTLDDENLKAKARAWIEPILASQRADGFFGPTKNDDWWPRMVATYLLRDYAEASGDARVAPFLSCYYRHMNEHLPARPLSAWGRARAGDEIDTVLWLYNRNGESWLLELADLLHEQAYPWREILTENRFLENGGDFMTCHNVNVPQALKMPAVYFQKSKSDADRAAYFAGIENLRRDHGTSFGIESGTEMLSGRASFEGVETCSIVERLLSDETSLRVFGDAKIGDSIEFLAFNALPAALSNNFHQHVYYTLANNVAAPRGNLGFEEDYADGRTPAPRSGFPCCCYNLHMGWPKLAQNAYAATPDGGLAALYYLPSQLETNLQSGAVSVVCETNYPFEDTISLQVSPAKPARFPLRLRVPAWCAAPQIRVNGKLQADVKAGSFAVIERVWKSGDRVELRFPMQPEIVRGATGALDTVSLRRGPLLYSLALPETRKSYAQNKLPGFDSYEVTSSAPWNYALVLDGANPIAVRQNKVSGNPFETGKAPQSLQVRARRVPQWTLQPNGLAAFDPPPSPVATGAATETLELTPFGLQMLRVTDFPTVGTPAPAPKSFRDDFVNGHPDQWISYRGGWFARDKELRPDEHRGASHIVAPRAVFSDFTLTARVTPPKTGDAGLTFRVTAPHFGDDAYQGYYVGLSAEKNQVILGRADGKWHPIAVAPQALEVGKSVALRIEARGDRIRVWVGDGVENRAAAPLLEARDASFANGAIGARFYGHTLGTSGPKFSALEAVKL